MDKKLLTGFCIEILEENETYICFNSLQVLRGFHIFTRRKSIPKVGNKSCRHIQIE